MAFFDRRREIEQRRTESFQQERTPFGVVAQQARTSFAVREPQRRDLVRGCIDRTRNGQLDNCGSSVGEHDRCDECLGRSVVRRPDGHSPVGFEVRNQRGKLGQPAVGAGNPRLVADNERDFDVSDPGSRAYALP